MANTYLTRSVSSSSNRKTWTWSGWVKRSDVTTGYQTLFSSYSDSNNYTRIIFWDTQQLTVSSKVASNFPIDYRLTRRFRDTSAWYHIVVAMDTTQATDTNRLKIYINGVLETAYEGSASSLPSQNEDTFINNNNVHYIGKLGDSTGYFGGLMSHIHLIDGAALAPTVFGSTDSTTGEWQINTSPSVTYGTNGFFILKDGNSVTDASTNSNNWTVTNGTLTKTEDCPSDVFATLNPLDSDLTSTPFLNGNTKVTGQNPESAKYYCGLTLGMMGNGKYYFEAQLNVNNQGVLGVCNLDASDNTTYLRQQNTFPGRYSSSFGYDLTDGGYYNNNSKTAYGGTSWSANDFISFALDNTNKKMYIAKNGSWVNSGNPTNGTGGIDYSSIGDNNMFIVADNNGSGYNRFSFNFGNGAFDNTALGTTYSPTVGNTGAKFKYNIIPTGYTALSTKGLNL